MIEFSKMTDAQLVIYFGRIERGLQLSVLRTLRNKAMLGRDVVYARVDGRPFVMPASEALRIYEASATSGERR